MTYDDAFDALGNDPAAVTDTNTVTGGDTGTVDITDTSIPGDTLTVTVTDNDLNTNSGVAETIVVTVVSDNGESEDVTINRDRT